MNLTLLCVGEVKGPLAPVVGDYEERIGRYWRFGVTVVGAGEGKAKKPDADRVREAEGDRLLAKLPEKGEVLALTREGRPWSSKNLARFMEEQALRSVPEVVFLIGGAYGLAPKVLGRSTRKLSLSSLTLPHELARLLLVEQLYRAGTILRNEPYHKGP